MNVEKSVGFLPINLVSGEGTSVLELANAFSEVSGQSILYQFTERHAGNINSCSANANEEKDLLGWDARLDIIEMCQDTWH